ncbi:MAG TPA: hypothetical protein PLY62_00630 [Bacteroidales bacterium]|nr:hypothetical protein [Bacteroidales bacterium]
MKKRSKKQKLSPDIIAKERDELVRRHRKTILFNEREMSLIEQYCTKYKISSKSTLFRDIIISHILQQVDDNYPKLF